MKTTWTGRSRLNRDNRALMPSRSMPDGVYLISRLD
jgi:hypothetical protein